jgi:hypothetical protein
LCGRSLGLLVTNYSGKFNSQKAYLDRLRKLGLYHFNAGIISGLRGDLDKSFLYFDKMEFYLDTLNRNGKGDEFKSLKSFMVYQKTMFCANTYIKDTSTFNRCNCMQFFPQIEDESIVTDSSKTSSKTQIRTSKYPYWGEFYMNDTLRINKHFVSDSNSINYFNNLFQPVILTKLIQNPYFLEMLGEPSISLIKDTLIYKLSSNYEKGKYDRNCELVFTSSKFPEKFDHFMFIISNMEFPGFIKDFEIYIPIIVTTQVSINTNQVSIYDDHFLIEVKKIKPIELH